AKTLSPAVWVPVPSVASVIVSAPQKLLSMVDAQFTPTLQGESSWRSFSRMLRCASAKYAGTSRRSGAPGPGTGQSSDPLPWQQKGRLLPSEFTVAAKKRPVRSLSCPSRTSRSGPQKKPLTFTWRPNATLPGPAARTVIWPHFSPGVAPNVASLPICTSPETSSVVGASAMTSALGSIASSQRVYAPPRNVSRPPLCTETLPYVPGPRSHRPFPGSKSVPLTQSRPASASTSFWALQVGNGVGKPHATARSPASTTHWPD